MILLLSRLIYKNPIRHSSSSREFFANIKKLYRSTTLRTPMASSNSNRQTCFVFDKDEDTKIFIQMVYELSPGSTRRKFNMFRAADEPLSQTLRRLANNIQNATDKTTKTKKNKKKSGENQEPIALQLYDGDHKLIDETLTNKQAWSIGRVMLINNQEYHIEYNAPAVIKFHFPELIMTNTITNALVELDYGESKYSLFDWYVTDDERAVNIDDDTENDIQWTHVHHGPVCTFSDEHVNRFVRLTCLPRNSSFREGMLADHRSKTRIIKSPSNLPMDKRHQLTDRPFSPDSNLLRLITYNILANGYAGSSGAEELIFSYCSPKYLDHSYRKPLILREIIGYNADIICLQECDIRFYERELTQTLNHFGYLGEMKIKSESVREGEVIFYRQDRFQYGSKTILNIKTGSNHADYLFSLIDDHSITIGKYFTESDLTSNLRQHFALLSEINQNLIERNTVLQLLAIQKCGQPNDIIIVCNTHLYFHPMADILRCLQVIVSLERIKEIKNFYEKQGKVVATVWGGDFNANVSSLAYQLLSTGNLVTDKNHRSYNADYAKLLEDFHYKSPIELNTFSNYNYTNYAPRFHEVIDHIFFQSNAFTFERSIPMPDHADVIESTAIPSRTIPSDHLSVVIELKLVK